MHALREREMPYHDRNRFGEFTLSFGPDVSQQEAFDFLTDYRNGHLIFSNGFYKVTRIFVNGRIPEDPGAFRRVGALIMCQGVAIEQVLHAQVEIPVVVDLRVDELIPPRSVVVVSTRMVVQGRELKGDIDMAWLVERDVDGTRANFEMSLGISGFHSNFLPSQQKFDQEMVEMARRIRAGFFRH